MNNFEFIILKLPEYVLTNPATLALFPIIIAALFYYFGTMMVANDWQYNKSSRFTSYVFGAKFLHEYFVMPILIVYLVILFLKKFNLSHYFGILLHTPPLVTGLLFVLFLLFLLYIDRKVYSKIKDLEFSLSIGARMLLGLVRVGDLKIIFYSLNYLFLTTTTNWLGIVFLFWIDFIILSEWARLSNLEKQSMEGTIILKNKNVSVKGRIIEQLNDGNLIKIQPKKGIVEFIPFSEIKEIKVEVKEGSKPLGIWGLIKLIWAITWGISNLYSFLNASPEKPPVKTRSFQVKIR